MCTYLHEFVLIRMTWKSGHLVYDAQFFLCNYLQSWQVYDPYSV